MLVKIYDNYPMITQHDIEQLKKTFATKNDLNKLKNDLLEAIYSMGDMLLKDTRNEINKHDDLLENHERRITVLEDKAFS